MSDARPRPTSRRCASSGRSSRPRSRAAGARETWERGVAGRRRRHRRARRRLARRGRRGRRRRAARDDAERPTSGTSCSPTSGPRARRQGLLKRADARGARRGRAAAARRVSRSTCSSHNEAAVAVWRRLGFEPRSSYRWRRRSSPSRHGWAGTHRRRAAPRTSRPTTTTPSSRRSRSTCRGSAAPLARTSPSRATAGRRSTTSSAAATRRRCAGSGRELSLAMGAIVLTLGIEEGAVVRYILWDRGGIADEYASVPEHFGPLAARRRHRARRRIRPSRSG